MSFYEETVDPFARANSETTFPEYRQQSLRMLWLSRLEQLPWLVEARVYMEF